MLLSPFTSLAIHTSNKMNSVIIFLKVQEFIKEIIKDLAKPSLTSTFLSWQITSSSFLSSSPSSFNTSSQVTQKDMWKQFDNKCHWGLGMISLIKLPSISKPGQKYFIYHQNTSTYAFSPKHYTKALGQNVNGLHDFQAQPEDTVSQTQAAAPTVCCHMPGTISQPNYHSDEHDYLPSSHRSLTLWLCLGS